MNKMNMTALKAMLLVLAMALALSGCAINQKTLEIPTEETYSYENPEPVVAQPDAGIVIDGILDEDVYKDNNWLFLYNNDGGNSVSIAMTSHYGENGMYFLYDVTESGRIYVNPDRSTVLNSCIEMYLAPSYASSMQDNGVFEIDLLPTGDMMFKRGNGKIENGNTGFSNVGSTNEIMARLGTTTKGGEVNTEGCYGYCMELFIPWDYMQWLGVDTESLKDGFVYVNPAHITSYNFTGKDMKLDRYWYHYAQQLGAKFSNVAQHFRFNGEGVIGGLPVTLQAGEHYTISGATNMIPGLDTFVTVKPDEGCALTSIMVNGEEKIQNVSFNEDGSVTLNLYGTNSSVEISAKAEVVSEGPKTLSGKVVLNNVNKDTWEGLALTCVGPNGEQTLEVDADGKFELKDMAPGYYVLKAEKANYKSTSCSVFLNRDTYVELVLGYEYFQIVQSKWDLSNQYDGIITILNKATDGSTVISTANTYKEVSVTVKDYTPSQNEDGSLKKGDFSMQVSFIFDNGKQLVVRMHNTDGDGKYRLQNMPEAPYIVAGWGKLGELTEAQTEKLLREGVTFTVKLVGSAAELYVDGTKMATVEIGAEYDGKLAQIKLCMNGNKNGQNIEIPFELK